MSGGLNAGRPKNFRKVEKVEIDGPLTAFGELQVAEPTPVVQLDAALGLRTKTEIETFTGTSGTASVENSGTSNEFKCTSGTDVGGYGLIRSQNYVRYRPGQGVNFRWTARYPDAGVANSTIRSGPVTSGTELSFGYVDTDFGVLFRTGGVLEVQTLTVSAGAGGAETGTVTLNGSPTNVPLTSGDTAHTAHEIATAATYSGWNAYSNNSTVVFVHAGTPANLSGSFTFTSDGTAAGTFSETQAGQAYTDTFIAQASWNIDPMDGSGPSRMILDTTKGNVYSVEYQYLGYGMISFGIGDDKTGRIVPVHQIRYANNNTTPSLQLPSLKLGWFAASLGSTTDLSIYGASGAGFQQGRTPVTRRAEGVSNTKTGIGTSYTSLVSIRNRAVLNGNINTARLKMLVASVAVEGTKPSTVALIANAELGGEPNWTYTDEDQSVIEFDTASTTVTVGNESQEILVFSLPKSGGERVDLSELNVFLNRTETLTLAVKASSGTVEASGGLTCVEQ